MTNIYDPEKYVQEFSQFSLPLPAALEALSKHPSFQCTWNPDGFHDAKVEHLSVISGELTHLVSADDETSVTAGGLAQFILKHSAVRSHILQSNWTRTFVDHVIDTYHECICCFFREKFWQGRSPPDPGEARQKGLVEVKKLEEFHAMHRAFAHLFEVIDEKICSEVENAIVAMRKELIELVHNEQEN